MPIHAILLNGRSWEEVEGVGRGERDDVFKTLARMDGKSFYSLVLWNLPAAKRLSETDPKLDAIEYIESRGAASKMTLQIRRREGSKVEQYVVGRYKKRRGSLALVAVPWNSTEEFVYTDEVFTAAEAGKLFLAYYLTGAVPRGSYAMRNITPLPKAAAGRLLILYGDDLEEEVKPNRLVEAIQRIKTNFDPELDEPYGVDVVNSVGDRMTVGYDEREGFLMFYSTAADDWQYSLGDVEREDTRVLYLPEWSEVSAKYMIPIEDLLEAVRVWAERGVLSDHIEWTTELY